MIIKLSNSDRLCIVDDNTIDPKILSMKWFLQKNGYVVCTLYLGKIGNKYVTKTIYLHRMIINAKKGFQVDHIDQNKLNNKSENLRICTNQENTRNTKSRKGSTSKYKGVCWDNETKKWLAQICIGKGKHKNLGRFINEEDAAKAYDAAAKLYHGEFAYLNYKDPPTS